jgi:hypothetical protein
MSQSASEGAWKPRMDTRLLAEQQRTLSEVCNRWQSRVAQMKPSLQSIRSFSSGKLYGDQCPTATNPKHQSVIGIHQMSTV